MSGDEFGEEPAFLGILMCLCVISLVLNVLVITVVLKDNKLKTPIDFFMLNLALSDILLGCVALPIKISNAARQGEDFYGGK